MKAVKVVAVLANELAGAAPQLDALLVKARCRYHDSPAHERFDPAPPLDAMPPTPLHREWLAGWLVHRCSSPILVDTAGERHSRVSQHFPRERSDLLASSERGTIATTNGAQKSYYLPIRKRLVDRVVWFAVVHDSPSTLRRELKRSVSHLGQDRAHGAGRVAEWSVEECDDDLSWFAPHPAGVVLMRQLPFGPHLPANLVGYRRDFNAVCPPYWHPGRMTEVVTPC